MSIKRMYVNDSDYKKVIEENTRLRTNEIKRFTDREIYGIIAGIVCIFLMFFLTICYTSRQKTIRKNIEMHNEYNVEIEER